MNRLTMTGCLLACCGGVSSLWAATPLPIDRPTPPPCAADGTCYPNECTWGWYPCHWRKWPGEELVPTPAGVQPTPAQRGGADLSPYETPSAEHEDVQAPPSTTKKPEASSTTAPDSEQSGSPEGGTPPRSAPSSGTPVAPAGPPQSGPNRGYSPPSYPTPYKPTPTPPQGTRQPTSDADPPPALPWQMSASLSRAATIGVSPETNSVRTAIRHTGDDPPPAIPSVFHSAAL
jgi:hypothetical protein